MTETILRSKNLRKKFGEFIAVDDVNITVNEGEFRSIIGPNGAGKTTLFNLITGAMSPTKGSVYFQGTDITEKPPHERVRKGLGRSFQITNVFGGLTIRENVRLAAQSVHRDRISTREEYWRGKDTFDHISAYTDNILKRIGLLNQQETVSQTLSYGNRRRLEIGLVLATDPSIVLLDEPTAGIGMEKSHETMNLIKEVLADRTLMLIEHDIDFVMSLSDSITVLTRGEVIAEGSPEEIKKNEDVREAYLGGAE